MFYQVIDILDTKFLGLVKMLNYTFDEFTVTKSESVKYFLCFLYEKVILINFAIFIYLQMYFWGWVQRTAAQVSSSGQRVGYKDRQV